VFPVCHLLTLYAIIDKEVLHSEQKQVFRSELACVRLMNKLVQDALGLQAVIGSKQAAGR